MPQTGQGSESAETEGAQTASSEALNRGGEMNIYRSHVNHNDPVLGELHLGQRVRIFRCMSMNPSHSAERYGFMLDGAEYDPDDRVICEAVGILVDQGLGDVGTVAFISEDCTMRTMAFVAAEDMKLTGDVYQFPANTDHMTVLYTE